MNIRLLSIILIGSLSILVLGTTTSCTKDPETITKTDTLYVNTTTTLHVRSIDTVFKMNANSWKAYSYLTSAQIDSGATKYFTTAEGVKAMGQGYRLGIRLQTPGEVGFVNKNVYWKWKAFGSGQFAGIVPEVKYDPNTDDANSDLMGVNFDYYSINGTTGAYKQVSENTWYYTRMSPVPNSDNYTIVTSIGNYSNQGGTVIHTRTIPVYTKSGYISIRLGDNYGSTNAYLVLGECKISGN